HFRKTARDDKRILRCGIGSISDGKAKGSGLPKKHLEIDLVHQNAHARAKSQLTDGADHFRGEKRAAGIVQIGEHDEARRGGDGALEFVQVHHEARFEAARKALHARAKIVGDVEKRAVGGLLEEHLVAGIKDGGHGEMIGHGSSGSGDDAFLRNAGVLREALLKRPVAVSAGSGDLEFVEVDGKFVAGNAGEAAGGETIFGVGTRLGPFHVERTFRASGTAHSAVASGLFARQKKYTGKPARAMPRPMKERRGSRPNVLTTTSHSAAMKSSVVQGWPETR